MLSNLDQEQPTALSAVFRFLDEADLPRMVELARQFFDESELPDFATFSEENIRRTFAGAIDNPDFITIVFAPEGQVEGFISFLLDAAYTEEPLALGWLFYVSPEYRKSPAGRELQKMAIQYATALGAVAFYNGVMAGIDGVAQSMPNMYQKLGFEPLWWGRRLLGGK